MSKIGKRPIKLDKAEAEIKDQVLLIKGPKGSISLELPFGLTVEIKDREILVKRKKTDHLTKSFHGTFRALIKNAIIGVNEGFRKELIFEGVGYRAEARGDKLILNVGYSHPVEYLVPKGINVSVKENKILIEGIDKQLVGQVSAEIRAIRPPDAYKGQGIRYADEKLVLKPGKAAAKGEEEQT